MNLSCSSRMIKYLMFAFNLFFVISGIIIIAVGATVKTVYSEYSDFLDSKYFTLPNMLIATGALIFVVSFFGCCGAIKESWIMLGVFSIFLCIIFIFEFSAGIAGYVLRNKTIDYLNTTLTNHMSTYTTSSNATWDLIQRSFQCCGVENYHDWKGIFTDPYALPVSCCPDVSGTAGIFYCNSYIPTTTTEGTTIRTTATSPTTTNLPPTSVPSTAPPTTLPPTTAPPTTLPPTTAPTTLPPTTTTIVTTTEPATTTAPPQTGKENSARLERRKREEVAAEAITTIAPPTSPESTSGPYQTGCKTAFGQYIKKHAVQIGGCALGLAIIQVLGIAFSCHLVRQLKNGYYST